MSDFCSCDSGDYCDVYDRKTRKSRKEHICSECEEKIEKNETYEKIDTLFDGYWSHMKICQYCWHDLQILKSIGMCPELGELKEAWAEAWFKNKK